MPISVLCSRTGFIRLRLAPRCQQAAPAGERTRAAALNAAGARFASQFTLKTARTARWSDMEIRSVVCAETSESAAAPFE